MSEEQPNIPYQSPVVPKLLSNDAVINFKCYKGIACFNNCCRHADITLTPYDILRLKKRLNLSTTEVLQKYTVPFEMDSLGMMGVKMKTQDENPVCLFMHDEGCSIYEDRPSACRYYPVGLMTLRKTGAPSEEHHYCLVKEDHCFGHNEKNQMTIAQYRKEQGVEEYDDMNREWYQIILKKRSSGPAIGKPPLMSLQMFFMCSFDIDRFRRFVNSSSFCKVYDLSDAELKLYEQHDNELLRFGYRLMKQVFFGEETIPMQQGALEKRIEERKEIIDMKHKLAVEIARQESPSMQANYMDEISSENK